MIEVAFTSRIGKEPKRGTTKTGKAMAPVTVAVAPEGAQDAPPTWVRILAFEDQAAELASAEPGMKVYVEGKLEASVWTPDNGGEPRLNINVVARRVVVMGRIGKRRPKQAPATGRAVAAFSPAPGGPQPTRLSREPAFDDEIPL